MKRKIIQHSPTSLVITLPSKWVRENSLKKGDLLNVENKGNHLIVQRDEPIKELKETEINITGLDRTTIMFCIRNIYRAGYDKVIINFKNDHTEKRLEQKVMVQSIIHQETKRMLGFEVVKEGPNQCVIQNISEGLIEDIPIIIRRSHLLLVDIMSTIYEATIKRSNDKLKLIEDKHETILRFVNYCLRSANKSIDETKINIEEYRQLATLDRIIYLLRSTARRLFKMTGPASKELIEILKHTLESLRAYHRIAHTKESKLLVQMNKKRYEVEKIIDKVGAKKEMEIPVFYYLKQIHNLLLDIVEVQGK